MKNYIFLVTVLNTFNLQSAYNSSPETIYGYALMNNELHTHLFRLETSAHQGSIHDALIYAYVIRALSNDEKSESNVKAAFNDMYKKDPIHNFIFDVNGKIKKKIRETILLSEGVGNCSEPYMVIGAAVKSKFLKIHNSASTNNNQHYCNAYKNLKSIVENQCSQLSGEAKQYFPDFFDAQGSLLKELIEPLRECIDYLEQNSVSKRPKK